MLGLWAFFSCKSKRWRHYATSCPQKEPPSPTQNAMVVGKGRLQVRRKNLGLKAVPLRALTSWTLGSVAFAACSLQFPRGPVNCFCQREWCH